MLLTIPCAVLHIRGCFITANLDFLIPSPFTPPPNPPQLATISLLSVSMSLFREHLYFKITHLLPVSFLTWTMSAEIALTVYQALF